MELKSSPYINNNGINYCLSHIDLIFFARELLYQINDPVLYNMRPNSYPFTI